jgi:hypothetical protein
MTIEQRLRFHYLAGAMSPENVMCDGEVSMAQGRRRLALLRSEWKGLEGVVGRKVSEDEIWANWVRR